jgi:hypothetical protein
MGVQPAAPQSELVPATRSTDTTAPNATVTAPAAGAAVAAGEPITISGTAVDAGGGVVGGVEVSVDGSTWHPATGRESWTYTWTPSADGAATVRVGAVDDSGNLGPPPPVTGGGGRPPCPCPPGGGAPAATTTAGSGRPVTPASGAGGVGGRGAPGTAATDRRGPRVSVGPRTVRPTRYGSVRLRVTCPMSETRCRVRVRLELGGRTVATTTLTIAGAATRAAGLRLTTATRHRLRAEHRLTAAAVARAHDAAGNTATTTTPIEILARRRRGR